MNIFSKFKIQQSGFYQKGFTLIELIVSVAIFTVVVVIAVGALYSAQRINIRLQESHNVLDGINLSVETMVRSIRYGYNFHCVTGNIVNLAATLDRKECPYNINNPTSSGEALVFKPSWANTNDRIAYYKDVDGVLWEEIRKEGVPVNVKNRLSSDDVIIEKLNFFVSADKLSFEQPLITIIIKGRTKQIKNNSPVDFNIQATAVSRLDDN